MNTRVGWCESTGENLAARSLDAPYCSSKHCMYGTLSTHVNDCKNFEVTFFFREKGSVYELVSSQRKLETLGRSN